MEEEKNIDNSVNVDFKGTISNIFREEKADMTQEEAIKNYKDEYIKKKNNLSDDESAYNEELEHLERVKKELLASLERVKKLETKIFGENSNKKEKMDKLKVNDINRNKAKGIKKENIEKEVKEENERTQD